MGHLKIVLKKVHNVEVVNCVKTLGIYVGHNKNLCNERNWSDKVLKMKLLLQRWQERSLTLLGKVAIIKSLALPIISYSASNCETPSWVTKSVNSLFYNFLWNGSEKVKRKSIIGKIDQGGINMIDVEAYFQALKASWVKRLCQADISASWFHLPACYFKGLHILDIIQDINFRNITDTEAFVRLPNFYKQVIEGFIACNAAKDKKQDSDKCIKELCIWGNTKIVNRQNKALYFPKWIEIGIIRVQDIKFINNKIDEQNIFSRLYKKTNYISEMYQIKYALGKICNTSLRCIQNACEHKISVQHQRQKDQWKTTKQIYEHLIQSNFENPTGLTFLKQLSPVINISKTYTIKIKLIKDKKISEFNFKLLNNILPCKKNLFKWKIMSNSQCGYCGKEENAEHMLFLCAHKFNFWKSCLGILDVKLSPEAMFLSTGSVSKDWCISVLQYCIFKISLVKYDKPLLSIKSFFTNLFFILSQFHELYSMNNYTDVCKYLKNILHYYNK